MLNMLKSLFQSSPAAHSPGTHSAYHEPLRPSWIIPNQLAVGRLPDVGDGIILQKLGIRAVISLCAVSEGVLPEDVQERFICNRYILPDSYYMLGVQPEDLASVVDLMHQCIELYSTVYIHCLAGMERSPTACVAYLCTYHHLEIWEALDVVKRSHPVANPSERQIQAIRTLVNRLTDSP